jgi:transposase
MDDAQVFLNAKTKKYYKSKWLFKPKKMACHFCKEKGHIKPKYKWKNVYCLIGFQRNYFLHLVAKRKERKSPLHKQKKRSSYVMEAFDNECLSESNNHLSD